MSLSWTSAAWFVDEESGDPGEKIPVRMIDVEATIKNRESGSICFTRSQTWHIISHRWSVDVAEFSNAVGNKLKRAKAKGDLRSYEMLFESGGFEKQPSYKKFVEFLNILHTDGVRSVWYDALCINQTDNEEKDKEIQRMGTYYAKSLGCYVVQHGIGKGFRLLDNGDQLPEWFSRAWTFQEWVLPTKVIFILDLGLEQRLRRTASTILLDDEGEGRKCSCCHHAATFNPRYIRKCIDKSDAGEELLSSERKYSKCSSTGHFKKIFGHTHWYFVDDLGYVFLVKVKLQLMNATSMPMQYTGTILQKEALSDAEFKLVDRLRLKTSLRRPSYYPMAKEKMMALAIEEISVRNCSNEEDRVLSILKLIGVEDVMQVRTGRSLHEQVIALGKSLVAKNKGDILVVLCLVDGWGNEMPRMSWAPHFHVNMDSWQACIKDLAERFVVSQYFDKFECHAKVESISNDGTLYLSTSLILAHITSSDHLDKVHKERRKPNEVNRAMALEVDGLVVLHLCARASPQHVKDACVIEPIKAPERNCIVLMAPHIETHLHHLAPKIPIWLVRMGRGYHQSNSIVYSYFLVCIGTEKNGLGPLHKIGYISVTQSDLVNQSPRLLSDEFSSTRCCIGGIGTSDLSEFVL